MSLTDIERCGENRTHLPGIEQARRQLIDARLSVELARTFQALADPTRVRLIGALAGAELCVCDLAAVLGMSQSAVSHQLRTLRDLRLVRARREGREVFYALDDDHIRALYEMGLKHVQHGPASP